MAASVYLLTVIILLSFEIIAAVGSSAPSQQNRNLDQCRPVIVAHRGASGYVPEHTLGAYALAITMGSDFVEPDLVMTSDRHLIARHENELSLTTDVADRPEFLNRYTTQNVDGEPTSGWFSEHFTLGEIKTLRAKELHPLIRPGNTRMDGSFDIPTMQEIIDLVKGMEISEQRVIGIYPELKHGLHFQQLNLSMEQPLVDLLHENGYQGPDAPIYIQSFEVSNLRGLRNMTDLRLIQLYSNTRNQPYDQVELGTGLSYVAMATAEGLREVATYAHAVGPHKNYILPVDANNNLGAVTQFVVDAHAAGLLVHPYTFRAENVHLPAEFRTNDSDIAIGDARGEVEAYFAAGIDGLFSDQPDIAARVRGHCTVPLPSSSSSMFGKLWLLIMSIFILEKDLLNLCIFKF